jgi:type 1 glutamine amidotransferase
MHIRRRVPAVLLACLLVAGTGRAAERAVLVYTRNFVTGGGGYVHDNIASCVEAIRKMGTENGFDVEVSDQPSVFTPARLARYRALIFANSNNEAFENEAQREAFKQYMQNGGGFVGVHSASGSERAWPYFWSVAGGRFLRHPKLQKFVVRVKDRAHASTRHLPPSFEWEDECYFLEFLNPDLHPLLVTDPAKLDDAARSKHPSELIGDSLPLAWTIQADGIRAFYTALGHKKEHYANPVLAKHILGGILWAMGDR